MNTPSHAVTMTDAAWLGQIIGCALNSLLLTLFFLSKDIIALQIVFLLVKCVILLLSASSILSLIKRLDFYGNVLNFEATFWFHYTL